jgi:hypothetical protein
MLSKK